MDKKEVNNKINAAALPLDASMLKLIALVSMTIDHVGLVLLHDAKAFRIIGRISFPIFAYMIALGCHYTHDKKKHFAGILFLGILCQIVYFVSERSLYQGVMIDFSLAILLIYAIEWAKKREKIQAWLLPAGMLGLILFLSVLLPVLWKESGLSFDYGFWGIMLSVWPSLSEDTKKRWGLLAIGLLILCVSEGGLQWYSLLSLPLLALYNGKRGLPIKIFFYVYYPLHLVLIYLLAMLLGVL